MRTTPPAKDAETAGEQASPSHGAGTVELVQRAREGDVRAFETLYREHVGRVYGLCLRMTRDPALAEDCTQEAFMNGWRALGRFETRSSLATWLHRIAVNAVLAKRRKTSAAEESLQCLQRSSATLENVRDEMPETHCSLDTPVEVHQLEVAIQRLPDGARDALVLCGIYGYSHAEAGEMLGVAEGTCKAQLHRARRLLRERLGVEIA